jgi:hypothetical protein
MVSTVTFQFSCYKDCLARRLLGLQPAEAEQMATVDELDDFTTYLASETWDDLPSPIQEASYDTRDAVPDPDSFTLESISPAFTDSLVSYGLVADEESAIQLLRKVLDDYVKEQCAAPPPWSATRTTECEICEREVPLTYHHLIPRSTHAKVLKKKWHPESKLNSVAWLCR